MVLTTGCSLGELMFAEAFIKTGCRLYIAPKDYVEGNAALFFVERFYYEIIANQRTEEAFQLVSNTDDETKLFQLYKLTF